MNILENLRKRAAILKALRGGFDAAGFIEVETATALKEIAPEEFIEAVCTDDGRFLRTSPELLMKRLLVSGMTAIYQIGPCFRAGERGSRHREEFTMLEFYRAGWDYMELLRFTAELLRTASEAVLGSSVLHFGGEKLDLSREPELITVAEAFEKYCRLSCAEAEEQGVFDELMVTRIEPHLGRGRLTFLLDYPAGRASLARLKPQDPACAERWELYGCGIELANAFGELTDAAVQHERFAAAREFRRGQDMHEYPESSRFFAALEKGLPESSGCALGLDRLCMLICDAPEIGMVRADDDLP